VVAECVDGPHEQQHFRVFIANRGTVSAAKSSFTELPTIDISDLAGESRQRQAVADHGRQRRAKSAFSTSPATASPELIAGVRAAAKRSSPCRWRKR
jgi:hypothetical protein